MLSQVERILAEEWPPVEAALSPKKPWAPGDSFPDLWESRMSPVIPAVWPREPGAADFYVYFSAAARNPTKLQDGEWFSNPWGRVRGNLVTQQFVFERFPVTPGKDGIQGVRPLLADEVAVIRDSRVIDEFAAALASGAVTPELSARVRAYYKLWLSAHGVARTIRPLHETFFDWVEGTFVVPPPEPTPPRPDPPKQEFRRPEPPLSSGSGIPAKAAPGSNMTPLQIRLLAGLMLICGIALIWWTWSERMADGKFSVRLGIAGPLMASFGLPALLFPQLNMQKAKPYWMTLVMASILGNLYLLYTL